MPDYVTCNRCGWVHWAFSLAAAQRAVADFNSYFDRLTSKQQQDSYGGVDGSPPRRAHLQRYLYCLGCGGPYTDFRDYQHGDCPDGVTINPILYYNETITEQIS